VEPVTILLLTANAAFASVFGWLLARHLARSGTRTSGVTFWFLILLGMYLAECVAFSASMGTNLLGVALAVVWGLIFGRKLRAQPPGESRRNAFRIALYTCLPAISFACILPLLVIEGWPILTTEGGRRLGIPAFVPWPASTVLGFFLTVVGFAVVCKTAITVGVASMLSQRQRDLRK